MKKRYRTLACATSLTLLASPTLADDLFVCVAVGVNLTDAASDTVNGFGGTESDASTAALVACRLGGNVSCQIAHCERTSLASRDADFSEGD